MEVVIFVEKNSMMVATEIKEEIKEMLEHFDQNDLTEILSFIKQKESKRQSTPFKLTEFADKVIEKEHNLLKRLAE